MSLENVEINVEELTLIIYEEIQQKVGFSVVMQACKIAAENKQRILKEIK